jgi:transcription-repair coupling factor (superfamily II helicase)
MDTVGYEMYCKLLNEVVKEYKGEKIEEEKDVIIDINVATYIPDEYIENNEQR